MSYPDYGLTFETLREANDKRNNTSWPQCADWTAADWVTAVTGELGEAANLIKKLRRGDAVAMEEIAYEIADVVCYLDLLASHLGIDLEGAVREKFNIVSRRVGSQVKL